MLLLVKFILIVLGVCMCIAIAKPLKSFREFVSKKSIAAGEFLSCPKCMSIWISPFAYLYVYKEISWDVIPFAFIAFGAMYLFEKLKCS